MEQVDENIVITPADATVDSQDDSEALNPENGAGKDAAGVIQDPEFELPGNRKVKQSELLAWEKSHQNSKRMEADYTQKTQTLAQQRKSFEQVFGRFPEQGELQALGKIYKSYSDPKYQKIIDAILNDKVDELFANPGQTKTPIENQLAEHRAELAELKKFRQEREEREENDRIAQGERVWKGWVSGMKTKGIEITEEIDSGMVPFIRALSDAYPDMEKQEILDKAYEHATIGQSNQKAIKQVLDQSGKAGKTGTTPITSKVGKKPDSEMSYSEIMAEGRQ